MSSVYGNVTEELPSDAPASLGKEVTITTYVDHDWTTGRAVTGTLHFLNGTPIDWLSKRQNTVETATYGSEFVAARIATDRIIDMRMTLRYLGVPIKGKSSMFGDNQSVVTSSTIPHSKLNKRHITLLYHRVREAIAAKALDFCNIDGKTNPADVLSKHCGHINAWPHLKWLLFWQGAPPLEGEVIPRKERGAQGLRARKWCLSRQSWGLSNNETRSHFMSRRLYLVPWRGVTRFQEFRVGLLSHGTIIEAGAKVIFRIPCASLDQYLYYWSIVSICIQ